VAVEGKINYPADPQRQKVRTLLTSIEKLASMTGMKKGFRRNTQFVKIQLPLPLPLLASTLISATCCASILSASIPPSSAANDPEFDAAMAAYKVRDFKRAIAHFSRSIQNGNRTASVYLFSGYAFSNLNDLPHAYQTYEIITKSFKGSPEAKEAAELMEKIKPSLTPGGAAASKNAAGTVTPSASATPGAAGLMGRIEVTPPQFSHPAVSKATIEAAQQAVAALPKPLRAKLDASAAKVIISPNMIDKWPESVKDLPESSDAPTLAELPGRIYGMDMCVYERAKVRGNTGLKEPRPPAVIRLQVANMCFQVLDGDAMTISKDPACRTAWESDKASIPESMESKLWTFMKTDDWGPRETCSELFGSMLGGRDESTDNLYRYFPNTKKWLAAKMGIAGQ
jgi:hypothetical protein